MSKERMDENLSRALQALAEETNQGGARDEVKAALLAEVRGRRGKHRQWWWQSAAAAVLLIGLGYGAARWSYSEPAPKDILAVAPAPHPVEERAPARVLDPVSASPETRATVAAVRRARPAPKSPERWSDAGQTKPVTPWYFNEGLPLAERGQVIRLEVPAATAAQFGVLARGPVKADLFIADDGLTRAIRFVQ